LLLGGLASKHWRERRKWNLLGVSKPYNWSLLQVFMTVLIGLIDFIAYV